MDQEELVFREIDNPKTFAVSRSKSEERCRKDMEARVRKQKNKWKIKSKRVKRMQNHGLERPTTDHVSMPYDETQTVETNKRARYRRLTPSAVTSARRLSVDRKTRRRRNGEGNVKIVSD